MIEVAARAEAATPSARHQAVWPRVLSVAVVVLAGFALRLWLGLQESLDPDEAVEGVTAMHILHGQFPLMESNGHYLGAFESYLLVPFVALLGPTLLALRVGIGVLGASYLLATYLLGRELFRRHREALLLAAIAAVFPLFALSFAEKARNYAGLLLFEVLCLALFIRVAWPAGASSPLRSVTAEERHNRREWLLLGLAAGLGMWNHPLLAVVLLPGVAAIIARAPALGWRSTLRGGSWAVAAALVGYAPAIAYNLESRLGSLRHLYGPFAAYSTAPATAAKQVVGAAIPVFVGTQTEWCGRAVVPAAVTDVAVLLIFAAATWIRRDHIVPVLRGQVSQIQPAEIVLTVAPLALVAVTVAFNSLSCEPRYLLPFAVPLVLAVAIIVRALPSRALGVVGMGVVLVINGLTVWFDLADAAWRYEPTVNLSAAVPALEAYHPRAIWATYWLARSIQYLDGDNFPVGDYGGYLGFPESQAAARAAPHPSWVFETNDPEAIRFEAACALRGIQFEQVVLPGGLILYANLSQPLEAEDLGLATQSATQAR